MTRRWGLTAGWRYLKAFVDEPGEVDVLCSYQWWELGLLVAGRRIPLLRLRGGWLYGVAPRQGAELVPSS